MQKSKYADYSLYIYISVMLGDMPYCDSTHQSGDERHLGQLNKEDGEVDHVDVARAALILERREQVPLEDAP